jgi:hypothetical protein
MYRTFIATLLLALSCRAQSAAGQAPVYKLLYSPSLESGLGTFDDVFEVTPGLFYVLSASNTGTVGPSVFSITVTGTVNVIYSFSQQTTSNWVVQSTNGRLYGSAYVGIPPNTTNNYFYSIDLSGKNLQELALRSPWLPGFNAVVAPPELMFDLIAQVSGSSNPLFAFVSVSKTSQVSILHQFTSSDGFPGNTHMVLGADGNIYNTGVQSLSGVTPMFIYRFTPSGAYSRIFTFPFNIPGQEVSLIAGSDGNLYGTVTIGSSGEIYQVTLSGQYQKLAKFPPSIPSPRTLMQAADGNFYGTNAYNQVYRYNSANHAVTLVYQMNVGGSQGSCPCILVEGMDGKLYGVAENGGTYPGTGAVFSLDIGLRKPQPLVSGLYPSSGPVGKQVVLWGNYLLGVKSLTFNGTPAAGPVATSVKSVVVTVPTGATSGPVTITTANGSFTTAENFNVQ